MMLGPPLREPDLAVTDLAADSLSSLASKEPQ